MGTSHSKRHNVRAHRQREDEHEQEQNGGQENERSQEHEQDQRRVQDQGEDGEQSSECIDEFSSFIKKTDIYSGIFYDYSVWSFGSISK